jgi:peptidylprolyl isomerase
MKHARVALALGAALALILTGCSSANKEAEPSSSANEQDADAKALEQVKWTNAKEGEPELEFTTPLSVSRVTVRIVNPGDGDEIPAGAKLTLDYATFDGEDGSEQGSTFSDGTPEEYQLPAGGTSGALTNPISSALVGQKVGVEAIIASPVTASDGSGTTRTLLLAARVAAAEPMPMRAQGEAVAVDNPALPTVTLADSGQPQITFPEGGEAPAELVAQTLIEGNGATVETGQAITIQYSGWVWGDSSKTFDTSWTEGIPRQFTLAEGSLIAGWVQGLAGKTVGSQVLLVIPPTLAYGEEQKENIPANSTLVFVVDILAAEAAPVQVDAG